MESGDFTQVRTTYDAVAADYAARFPTTEPEDALDLATIEHFVRLLGPSPTVLDLPYADASTDGVLYWYSVIHSPDDLVPRIAAEAARVVRPGGHVLLAFQVGTGSRDVANGYRAAGHDVSLTRFHRSVTQVTDTLEAAGFDIVARLERGPAPDEKDPQAFVTAGNCRR